MNLKYKIIEVYPQYHQIVVRFYTDIITEQMLSVQVDENTGAILRCRTDYAIDLPVPAPTGDALDAFISKYAPRDWLQTQEAVLNPAIDTSLAAIQSLVNVEKVALPASVAPTAIATATTVTTPQNIQTV